MNETSLWAQYRQEVANDPMLALALTAALAALALTPLAFAVLGRMEWFQARRGRVLQRPTFASIVVGMLLVMGIPAIFSAMVLKSRSYDKDRYEFDPNKRWSVLEQGRGLKDVQDADAAVKREMDRLATERKNLVENVKKLDEQMLALRAVAGTSVPVAQRVPGVLQALAGVRRSVGLDGPQQLMDFTAPPVDLRAAAAAAPASMMVPMAAGVAAASPTTPTVGAGLSLAEAEAEVASVPEPQRSIAAMLPLAGLPAGWTIAKSGNKHLETFNADNLYEKIDGRAESFIQYDVQGMAYASYHPTGDTDNDVQLYIFEMADPLKALGKYGSEKPEESTAVAIGDEGYTSAGSTLFHAGKYYTQIVSTSEDPKFAAFALDLAKRVAAKQKPAGAKASGSVASANPEGEGEGSKPAEAAVTPATYFGMLPKKGREGEAKYVAQDAFGYSFLSDVFMADYKEGETTWQGFLRPYKDEAEAKAVFQKYLDGAKKDGAEIKPVKTEGADEMVVSSNIGLVDVVFRKGNTLAGANGGTTAGPPEQFARGLAKSLPANVPPLSK